jgi:aarF domain-containing kinase
MLEASRKELSEQVPEFIQSSKKYRRGIYFFVDSYMVEPIATGLRFLHLVIIFVPVIVSIPAIWLGNRQLDRGNERSGTLWWYGFLVRSMERSGAAFIKVIHLATMLSPANHAARTMGRVPNRYISHRDV